MTSARVRLLGLLSIVILGAQALGGSAQAAERTPVFVSPLNVDEPFAAWEPTLRAALTASLISTGKYSETVQAETEQLVQDCVSSVNRDVNSEGCWVRVGLGQGASLLVSGQLRGNAASCTVTLRLTDLETRVSERMHFRPLARCGYADLLTEMQIAGKVLAGQEASSASAASARVPVVAPAVVPQGPRVSSGRVTEAVGDLTISAKPKALARLEITDPAGRTMASGSPYKNPQAPVGRWRVVVRAQGYADEELSVQVPPDEPTLAKVELKQLGSLLIEGSPEGAKVRVQGPRAFDSQGGLPWTGEGLRPGSYRVTVEREGYKRYVRSLDVLPGGRTREPVNLKKDLRASKRKTSSNKGQKKLGLGGGFGKDWTFSLGTGADYLYYASSDGGGLTSSGFGLSPRLGVFLGPQIELGVKLQAARVTYSNASGGSSVEGFDESHSERPGTILGAGAYLGYAYTLGSLVMGYRMAMLYDFWVDMEGLSERDAGSGAAFEFGIGLARGFGSERFGGSLFIEGTYGLRKHAWSGASSSAALEREYNGFILSVGGGLAF